MVFEIGKFVAISLVSACVLFFLLRKKSRIDILDLRYNSRTKKIRLVLRNRGFAPLTINSSLRLVRTAVPCEWRVSPDETIPYEIRVPMMPGRYNKLRRMCTLLGEKFLILDANDVSEIIYEPFEDVSVGDHVDIDLLYGDGELNNSLKMTIAIKPETVPSLSLVCPDRSWGVGMSIGETLTPESFLAS